MTLEKSLSQTNDPKLLALTNLDLTDKDIPLLIRHLETNPSCTTLDLSTNHVTATGVNLIAQTLRSIPTLRELNLRSNQLTDLGIAELAAALSTKDATIQVLYLGNNVITDSGAKQLATMLEVNRSLTDLWLEENCIGDGGVEHLSRSLTQSNHVLRNLYLHNNPPITDLSVDTLLNMLHHNRTMQMIDLEGCSISRLGQNRMIAEEESRVRVDLNSQMDLPERNKTVSRVSVPAVDKMTSSTKQVNQSGVCVIF